MSVSKVSKDSQEFKERLEIATTHFYNGLSEIEKRIYPAKILRALITEFELTDLPASSISQPGNERLARIVIEREDRSFNLIFNNHLIGPWNWLLMQEKGWNLDPQNSEIIIIYTKEHGIMDPYSIKDRLIDIVINK